MQIESAFEVPGPPEPAWRLLNDVPRVIPCMPGAELTEVIDESTWKATMHVKLGPISLQFATDVRRIEVDETARRAVLFADARELKGRGGAKATIASTLVPTGTGTSVKIVTDLQLRGPVAQYGRGIVADVAGQLVKRFAECLATQLEPAEEKGETPTPAIRADLKPVGGLGLAFGAIWRRLVALFRRGT
jgi:carbon monoxide dehydrogenase subunit G